MKSILGRKQFGLAIAALAFLTACQTVEPRPSGVSRFVSLSVTPLYPKSYEIVASSMHSIYGHFDVAELKAAWQKKAVLVANGRRFKTSPLIVHDGESDIGGWPSKARSVSGTITVID